MGKTKMLFIVLGIVIVAVGMQLFSNISKPMPVPNFDVKKYWGPGNAVKDDTKIEKFVIDYKKEVRCL